MSARQSASSFFKVGHIVSAEHEDCRTVFPFHRDRPGLRCLLSIRGAQHKNIGYGRILASCSIGSCVGGHLRRRRWNRGQHVHEGQLHERREPERGPQIIDKREEGRDKGSEPA